MGEKGQSSDPQRPSLRPRWACRSSPGLIEIITAESSAPGERHAPLVTPSRRPVGEIAVLAWPGESARPDTQVSGVRWCCARAWSRFRRSTFVTPAFPGYYSGHSTFSRSAAEVMTLMTGSPFFPGGLEEFVAPQNDFLQFEVGPSTDVRLQWATLLRRRRPGGAVAPVGRHPRQRRRLHGPHQRPPDRHRRVCESADVLRRHRALRALSPTAQRRRCLRAARVPWEDSLSSDRDRPRCGRWRSPPHRSRPRSA